MYLNYVRSLLLIAPMLLSISSGKAQQPGGRISGMPQLVTHGNVTQLYVDNHPFLILGGELNNSTSSSMAYLQPVWKQVKDLHFNTLLTPLSWELIEPKEGVFNFNLVDSLITAARQNDMHLVFLWLASWKNGMSSYVPLWVKENYKKYPRVKIHDDGVTEVLSAIVETNCKADARAFAMLMKHIREFDGNEHTVLMMQVENEVGILGDSRDRSEPANTAFNKAVPKELISYLKKNKDKLVPEVKSRWEQNGFKTGGNWEEIFGKSPETDEIFMAWNYAGYVNRVAQAGKKNTPYPCTPMPGLTRGITLNPEITQVADRWQG